MSVEPSQPDARCPCPPELENSDTGCAYWTWDSAQQKYVLSGNYCKPGYVPCPPERQGDCCDPVCTPCVLGNPGQG